MMRNIYLNEEIARFMQTEKTGKIFFSILLFGLSAMILFSYDDNNSNHKSNVFAQTPDPSTDPTATPENNYTNTGNDPTPVDNSTDLNNITSPPGISDSDNLTNSGLPSDTSPSYNNTVDQGQIQTNPPSVPEFGSLAQIILVIAVSLTILSRTILSRFHK